MVFDKRVFIIDFLIFYWANIEGKQCKHFNRKPQNDNKGAT